MAVPRTVKETRIIFKEFSGVCVHRVPKGIFVTNYLIIDEKLKGISSVNTVIFHDPEMSFFEAKVGNTSEKAFMLYHRHINIGTPDAPTFETAIPMSLVAQITRITDEVEIFFPS